MSTNEKFLSENSTGLDCIIHIGAPKTGTTALQRFLFENRSLLASQGLLYPDVSLRGYGHHDMAFLLNGQYPAWASPPPTPVDLEMIEDQLRQAAQHDGKLLLSSEDFYLFPQPEALAALLERAGIAAARRITIVVYLRRQDDAHESWYNQAIKAQGATQDVTSFVTQWRDLWDYNLQLARWSAVFGQNNMRVRLYQTSENESHGQTLFDDFFEAIGHSHELPDYPATAVNTSLNRDIAEYQRLVNALPLSPVERRKFHHQLMELSTRTKGCGIFDESPFLGPQSRQQLLDEYKVSNQAVAQTYLNGAPLWADFPETSFTTTAVEPYAGLKPEKLAMIQAWLMSKSTT